MSVVPVHHGTGYFCSAVLWQQLWNAIRRHCVLLVESPLEFTNRFTVQCRAIVISVGGENRLVAKVNSDTTGWVTGPV